MNLSEKKIGIITLTIGNWDLMGPHFESIYRTYPYPKEIFIIPNIDYGLSLSAAINTGFKRAIAEKCDALCYIADDVTVGDGAIETVVRHLLENELWMVNASGENSSGWDFFAVRDIIFEQIGFWDESFYPAYFEDNDFARRLWIKEQHIGQKMHDYISVPFVHLGSQTIKRLDGAELNKHHENFNKNKAHYVAKWGGEPGNEKFMFPFNVDYSSFPGI